MPGASPMTAPPPAPPLALVLAGGAEARQVLDALAPEAASGRIRLLASLAGATRRPRPLPAETRSGGFGGVAGLEAFLRAQRPAALLDATHPFAARISANAALACARLAIPRAQLRRPPWPERITGPAARFATLAEALAAAPAQARVLAATGRGSAEALAPVAAARPDLSVFLRVAEAGPAAPPLHMIVARPPHDAAAERALFARLRPTHLLTRDSGGADTEKLLAAREAGARILIVDRPPPEAGEVLATAEAAVDWLRAHLGLPMS